MLSAITSFLEYFSVKKLDLEEFGLLLAEYVLDRRSWFDFVTEDGMDLALNAMLSVATCSSVTVEDIEKSLIPEWESYCDLRDQFYEPAKDGETAVQWWNSRAGVCNPREIALTFARLKSSANIERTFSALKYIQGSHRHNL